MRQEPTTTDWPEDVLAHTRRMAMRCTSEKVVLKQDYLNGRPLAALYTVNAGAPEGIEASDGWGRVLAFVLALIKLGVPPHVVLNTLKSVPR